MEIKAAALSGETQAPGVVRERMFEMIAQKIERNPDQNSYPAYFTEYLRIHFQNHPTQDVLVVQDGTTIDGDLELDWSASWAKANRASALVCFGDLTINGTIRNRSLNGGPLLFVGGNLRARNVVKSGAPFEVLGDLIAEDGLVVGEYNDGVTRVGGGVRCAYFINLDHDFYVRGSISGRTLYSDDEDLRSVLVPTVFVDEDEYAPDAELLLAHHRSNQKLLQD